ncbi:MAG: hypothetical protein MZV70_56095 [Desulfobacterales bacterium]|nr:hypothetical protein [Desulfobacterales bacterium]
MMSKLTAARKVNSAGVPMVVAKGRQAGHPDAAAGRASRTAPISCPAGRSSPGANAGSPSRSSPRAASRSTPAPRPPLTRARQEPARQRDRRRSRASLPSARAVEFQGPAGEAIGVGLVNYGAADIRRDHGAQVPAHPAGPGAQALRRGDPPGQSCDHAPLR